jgi:hypothetical protein
MLKIDMPPFQSFDHSVGKIGISSSQIAGHGGVIAQRNVSIPILDESVGTQAMSWIPLGLMVRVIHRISRPQRAATERKDILRFINFACFLVSIYAIGNMISTGLNSASTSALSDDDLVSYIINVLTHGWRVRVPRENQLSNAMRIPT